MKKMNALSQSLAKFAETVDKKKKSLDARIAAKSKRITSKTAETAAEIRRNRFANLANYFFYPIFALYNSQRMTLLDLQGRDYFVLARILYTLGKIGRAHV